MALAALAVIVLTVEAGGLPWISLALATSFAIYGFLRKTLPIGPSQGFFLEVLILSVPSLAYIIWLQAHGEGHFVSSQPDNMLLLVLCGPATAVPLMLYGFGAKLLRFSTIGIMQYIAPTMVFLIAVFVFREPLGHLEDGRLRADLDRACPLFLVDVLGPRAAAVHEIRDAGCDLSTG